MVEEMLYINTVKYDIFGFWDFSGIFWFFYDVLEAREVFKNLPGARGFVFPKYEPVASHGDPFMPVNMQIWHILYVFHKKI